MKNYFVQMNIFMERADHMQTFVCNILNFMATLLDLRHDPFGILIYLG